MCHIHSPRYGDFYDMSICESCFRKAVAAVNDKYHGERQRALRKIAEHEAAQAERHVGGRTKGTVDRYLARLEQDLADARLVRDSEIESIKRRRDREGDR